jgi:hypothetical protein
MERFVTIFKKLMNDYINYYNVTTFLIISAYYIYLVNFPSQNFNDLFIYLKTHGY